MTLFFLHVPRTGGTALRLAFQDLFGEDKVLSLYTPDGSETTPAARQLFFGPDGAPATGGFDLLSDHIVASGIELFTSHQSADKLRCFAADRSFIMLRHPVDRLVSAYRYVRHRRHTEMSFDEYISHPGRQNVQSRLLGSTPLESLGVVGVFDHYEEFIQCLRTTFGVPLQVKRQNQNRFVSRRFLPFCSPNMMDKIVRTNKCDLEMYERATKLVAARVGDGTASPSADEGWDETGLIEASGR